MASVTARATRHAARRTAPPAGIAGCVYSRSLSAKCHIMSTRSDMIRFRPAICCAAMRYAFSARWPTTNPGHQRVWLYSIAQSYQIRARLCATRLPLGLVQLQGWAPDSGFRQRIDQRHRLATQVNLRTELSAKSAAKIRCRPRPLLLSRSAGDSTSNGASESIVKEIVTLWRK